MRRDNRVKNPERFQIMDNNFYRFVASHIAPNSHFANVSIEPLDQIDYDAVTSRRISEDTGKNIVAATVSNYGVGIFFNEENNFGFYGDEKDKTYALRSYVMEYADEISDLFYYSDFEGKVCALIIILCGYITEVAESTQFSIAWPLLILKKSGWKTA